MMQWGLPCGEEKGQDMIQWGLPCGEEPKKPMIDKILILLGQILAILFFGLNLLGALVLLGILSHLAFNVAYWGWRLI